MCDKTEGKVKHNEDGFKDYLSVSEDTAIVGSFSGDSPEITISDQVLESFFIWYYETLEIEVEFVNAYIDDDLNEEEPIIYLILQGITTNDGSNAIVGFQITRNYTDESYIATALFGGKWSCTGVNCTGCSPVRSGGRWSKVTGCNCTGASGDPDKPSYCNHSTSGGGNGAAWVGALIGFIGLFGG